MIEQGDMAVEQKRVSLKEAIAGAQIGGAGTQRVTLDMIEQAQRSNAQKLAELLDRLGGIHSTLTGDPHGGPAEDKDVQQGMLPRLHDIATLQAALINRIGLTVDNIQASLG